MQALAGTENKNTLQPSLFLLKRKLGCFGGHIFSQTAIFNRRRSIPPGTDEFAEHIFSQSKNLSPLRKVRAKFFPDMRSLCKVRRVITDDESLFIKNDPVERQRCFGAV